MKADAFIKVLRTIINEEVRKVVREELKTLNENSQSSNTKSFYQEPKISLRDKYKDVLNSEDLGSLSSMHNQRVPLNKDGKPAVVNLSGNGLVNSILMETAKQMQQDPGSNSFFEGLR